MFRKKSPALDVTTAKQLMEQLADPDKDSPFCQHCGGWHARSCPRVKSLSFKGNEVAQVEFFQTYDTNGILWPEDIASIAISEEPNVQE